MKIACFMGISVYRGKKRRKIWDQPNHLVISELDVKITRFHCIMSLWLSNLIVL